MNKTILITGSSTGIGRATAFKFQKEGWNVIATMRTPEKEEGLDKLDNVLVTKLDVLELGTIDSALAAGIDRFGKIDVVLNNAGYGLMGTFEAIKRESMVRQFGVNVQGLFDVTQKTLPHFRKNKSGMFINISSIGGRMTFPFLSVYNSTKFAVEGFSEGLHWELASIGVKVKIVEPGGVATDFGGRSLDMQHDPELAGYNDFFNTFTEAFGKTMDPSMMSTPEMIADVIYKAANDESDTLRFAAGADAEQLLAARSSMVDEEFFNMIKTNFGF
ncbi:MAG: SDR family oxidoreductase [Leptolyngbya sp. SIO3F4]|nr:SDR family oxidoreductase [Leptolyngbya sp. SIO3F4]